MEVAKLHVPTYVPTKASHGDSQHMLTPDDSWGGDDRAVVLSAHPTAPVLTPYTSTPEKGLEGLVGHILTYPLHVVRGMDVCWAQLHERVEDLVQHLQARQIPWGRQGTALPSEGQHQRAGWTLQKWHRLPQICRVTQLISAGKVPQGQESGPREQGMGLPLAWGCQPHPLPTLGDTSALAHLRLHFRVPPAPTHHSDSIIQEGLAKHDDEEGLIYVDLFEDSQHCHGVHSRDEAAEEQEIHEPCFHTWIC